MAGARHLRGTIFTRVSNLLRSGAIQDKPVWFDVMETFPPLLPTKINRKPEPGRVKKLEYPEDFFRRKFYSTYQTYGVLNLKEGVQQSSTDCERFVEKCQEFVSQGMSEDEALSHASQYFTTEFPSSEELAYPEFSEPLSDDNTDEVFDIDQFLHQEIKDTDT
ncbi:28S ribosomal protein S23, mitochondrial [Exaiptasia diaphana]|uniref:Small ribosomal subunit protein mS23 n=1 Tax=Exaiptasia diaphana TaxID=2652724 RepID=A0A913XZX1_EXADI|nr:28S ribosomal protein S23, mitochondrial [Exaiptasia diaphana]KXJ23376.1 28S ribosomal protein S23, mitochondrial [Exaiptasia diaphana]